jgi:preprotein translocase subunit YajC
MDPLSTGLLIVLMVAAFYLLIIRPNKRRKVEQDRLHAALQPGARVMLSSGIYGNVASVGERQVVVSVAPGVELTVLKQAVLQAVTPDSQFAEDVPADHEAIDPSQPDTAGNPAANPGGYADRPADPTTPGLDEPGTRFDPRPASDTEQPDSQAPERDGGPWPSEGGEKR